MRQIKFRGMSTQWKENKWVYGLLAYIDGERALISTEYTDYDSDFCKLTNLVEVDPKTIGQFTGLQSKSGKEIYEGDIVNWRYFNNLTVPTKVEYIQVGASDDMGLDMIGFQCFSGDEVIGNVHENPELLLRETIENDKKLKK